MALKRGSSNRINVCLIQDSPIFFDKTATIEKAVELIKKAGNRNNHLVVFPESFVPGYPRGFDFGARVGSRTMEGRYLYQEYYDNSVDLEEQEVKILENASRESGVYVVMGITEKVKNHSSLYCTMVYISPTKGMLGLHRKIKPTGTERIIWAESDGSTLSSFDTAIGRIGGLICWENYMPLARMAMYRKGVEIYIAPTADSRDSWTTTMQHIAMEGRCFVLGCNQYFHKSDIPAKYQDLLIDVPDVMCRGGSLVVGPDGRILAGPLYGKPGLLEVGIDLNKVTQSSLDFDPAGHYSRQDIFSFKVKGQPPITVEEHLKKEP